MFRSSRQVPNQKRLPPPALSKGGSAKQGGGGRSATLLMLLVTLIGAVLIVVNCFYLFPQAGMNAPIKTDQSTTETSTKTAQEKVQKAAEQKTVKYHIIFSSGCSPKQDFQAYIFFYHALKSGQPGTVWRIASCKDVNEKNSVIAHHTEFIDPMSDNFKLHVTPDYSNIKPSGNFHYFNKPFSTHHWMENELGYQPHHKSVGDNPHDDSIIILCDPDQIIMRPFTNNKFYNESEVWMKRTTFPIIDHVTHGKPMGQMYGFFEQWATKTNISRYVPKEELPSHVQTMSRSELNENYAVGPPYIATAHDFYTIVTRWKDFVPLVHDDYPYLLAEMFAYCLAAAHSKLPHQVAAGFMVSDVGSLGTEGWDLLDPHNRRDVCTPGKVPVEHLPHILHYCQRYTLGKFVIGKHRIPSTFLSCEHPLLTVPPPDLAEKFDFAIDPDRTPDQLLRVGKITVKNHAFMLCHLIPYLNEAAIYWKDHHCSGKTVNKNESLVFFPNMEVHPSFFEKGN